MDGSIKLAFSVAEAAVYAGVCRDSIYGAIRQGGLRARKAGRRTLILRDDLEHYLHQLPDLALRETATAEDAVLSSKAR